MQQLVNTGSVMTQATSRAECGRGESRLLPAAAENAGGPQFGDDDEYHERAEHHVAGVGDEARDAFTGLELPAHSLEP